MAEKELIYPKGWDRFRRLTFTPGVKKGNLIFLTGMTAVNHKTGDFIGEGDMAAQTRQIYQNLREILETAGASIADIVQTTDYVRTTEGYKETAAVRREVFGDKFPASTGFMVAALLNPKALIEIDAIAVVDD